MGYELHIHIHPDAVGDPEEVLANFPFESGQSILTSAGDVIVIDLADIEDTNYVQDWYLNSHDDVLSFFVVED
jgi:hypothetical protein